jgi:signal transduction histidine kinase
MKSKTNIKSLAWLMLISELMIIGFVIQWLVMQYNNANDFLYKNVSNEFAKSEQQFMDSILVKTLINPIINDNDSIKHKINEMNTAVVKNVEEKNTDSAEVKEQMSVCTNENKVVKSKHDSDIENGTNNNIDLYADGNESSLLKKKIVMQGTELIIREVCDIADSNNCFTEYFMKPGDSAFFNNILKRNILKLGLNASVIWKNKSNDRQAKESSLMMMESAVLSQTIGVILDGKEMYLFKKIASQLFFALVLIVLTSVSFGLAFKSIRNQMRLNVLKSDFISNVSHELKTPVTTVKVAIEALKNYNSNLDAKHTHDYLQMANMEIGRLELLIDKVMNTALLQNHNHLISKETADLKVVVSELLESLAIWFSHKNANVEFIASDAFYEAPVDVLHVEGVLKNLLDNSFKYGIKAVKVRISLTQNENEIIISVTDNGPGIDHEYLDKVFDHFFRVPKGNKHNIKGYGLGLSYADLVMKQHGGKITVENNQQGSGCTFALHFPKK